MACPVFLQPLSATRALPLEEIRALRSVAKYYHSGTCIAANKNLKEKEQSKEKIIRVKGAFGTLGLTIALLGVGFFCLFGRVAEESEYNGVWKMNSRRFGWGGLIIISV